MNKGKKLTFYLVMVLVVEIRMEKMRCRRRSPFLFSFPPFSFQNVRVWRRQVLLDPRNVSFKMFVITNNWAVACSVRRAAGIHFSSSPVSPRAGFFALSPTLRRELAGWGDDIQPLSLLSHSSSSSCQRSRWKNAPLSSAVRCPLGLSQLTPAEAPSALAARA